MRRKMPCVRSGLMSSIRPAKNPVKASKSIEIAVVMRPHLCKGRGGEEEEEYERVGHPSTNLLTTDRHPPPARGRTRSGTTRARQGRQRKGQLNDEKGKETGDVRGVSACVSCARIKPGAHRATIPWFQTRTNHPPPPCLWRTDLEKVAENVEEGKVKDLLDRAGDGGDRRRRHRVGSHRHFVPVRQIEPLKLRSRRRMALAMG